MKGLGYTSIKTIEGGCNAYIEFDPLDESDKKPRWKLTGSSSGARHAYNDGKADDSA